MKTIFISAFQRQQVKDILLTDVRKILAESSSVRSVFLVPSYRVSEYKKEFKGGNVRFEGINDTPAFVSGIDALFGRISRYYIDTPSARALIKKKRGIRYVLSILMLTLFGNSKLLRSVARFLDYQLVRDMRYQTVFEKYHPDLVFLSHIEFSLGRSLLRHAKKRGIHTISLFISLNVARASRHPLRLLPDKLIVYNEMMGKFGANYLDMPREDIFVSGIPSFDYYISGSRIQRKEFCEKFDIDPNRKIILFVSVATMNPTEYQVLELLSNALKAGRLSEDIVFLVRNYPTEGRVKGSLVTGDLRLISHFAFDNAKTFLESGKTHTEGLIEDIKHTADSLYHSDAVITTGSVMAIEASIFDRPVINLGFDGLEEKTQEESVLRYYSSVNTKGTKIAHDFDELITYLNQYLNNPKLDSTERREMAKEYCCKLDGKSGKRVANFLLTTL